MSSTERGAWGAPAPDLNPFNSESSSQTASTFRSSSSLTQPVASGNFERPETQSGLQSSHSIRGRGVALPKKNLGMTVLYYTICTLAALALLATLAASLTTGGVAIFVGVVPLLLLSAKIAGISSAVTVISSTILAIINRKIKNADIRAEVARVNAGM